MTLRAGHLLAFLRADEIALKPEPQGPDFCLGSRYKPRNEPLFPIAADKGPFLYKQHDPRALAHFTLLRAAGTVNRVVAVLHDLLRFGVPAHFRSSYLLTRTQTVPGITP